MGPGLACPGRSVRLAVPAGTCLAAVLAGWPAMLAGPGGTGPPGPGTSAVLTAVRVPQARVLNPGPPTGLTASAGNTRVSLSWRPPASDGGAAIIGYDVYMGTSPGGESRSSVSGLTGGTSFTVTGLTNGTTYYFTVDAVNGAELHSTPSAPASATPVTAPGAPRSLTVTAGDAQVSLSWQAPASDGGTAITGYHAYQGTTRKLVASATGTSATVKNLTNGTAYSFTVTAVNQAGEGPASGSASATPTAAAGTPGSPNGPTSGPGNGQSATPTTGASASASASATASTSAPAGGPTGPAPPRTCGPCRNRARPAR
jgi:Fibronectin type III domain